MAERIRRALRRSRGRDPLGLRRALPDRLLPALVAAMTLIAALALAGALGAAALAERWQQGAAAAVTVQLPQPARGAAADTARLQRAAAALAALPEVAEARPVDQARLAALLRPWLGESPALPLPAVVELRLRRLPDDPEALSARLAAAVPGGVVETHGVWVARLVALAHSVQGVALAAMALVTAVATAVVAVAIRAGLAARRQAIGILHDLGATDGDIAGRFAARIAWLAALGGAAGVALAAPILATLAAMAAPVLGGGAAPGWEGLPWLPLLLLPLLAGLLGWLTAQVTVRRWLLRLP